VRVRTLIIPPTHMHADAIGRNIGQRMIQRFHLDLGIPQEARLIQILKARVPSHRQIRTIEL
jgi:hypothetical protein